MWHLCKNVKKLIVRCRANDVTYKTICHHAVCPADTATNISVQMLREILHCCLSTQH